jgi:hypothetical protein
MDFRVHEGFPVSWVFWLGPTSEISISIPTGGVYWVSSTTGVWFPGSILGDEISSKLTNYGGRGGFCSLPYGY